MTDARVEMARSFDVGPLRLSVRSNALWTPALESLLASYHCGPTAIDSSTDFRCETARLHVEADLGVSSPTTSVSRARPAFVCRNNGRWSDASVVWDAEIMRKATDRVRAVFLLHDRTSSVGRTADAMRRDTVAACLRALLATTATFADALLVHAAGLISPAGHGMLFLGRSGQGKTTLARRLPHWTLLADDTSLVFRSAGAGFFLSGTPIAGKEGLPRRHAAAPLHHIVALEKDAVQLRLVRLDAAETFAALTQRVLSFAADPQLAERLLELAQRLAETVPGLRLSSSLRHDIGGVLESPGMAKL